MAAHLWASPWSASFRTSEKWSHDCVAHIDIYFCSHVLSIHHLQLLHVDCSLVTVMNHPFELGIVRWSQHVDRSCIQLSCDEEFWCNFVPISLVDLSCDVFSGCIGERDIITRWMTRGDENRGSPRYSTAAAILKSLKRIKRTSRSCNSTLHNLLCGVNGWKNDKLMNRKKAKCRTSRSFTLVYAYLDTRVLID